jgi:hypothetical protein
MLQDINEFIENINDTLRVEGIEIGLDVELVLEPMLSSKGNEVVCGYYYVDHGARCLFWLEDFDASYILKDVKGAKSPAHIGLEVEAQYWSIISRLLVYSTDIQIQDSLGALSRCTSSATFYSQRVEGRHGALIRR